MALSEAAELVSLADETKMPPSTAARARWHNMRVSWDSVICHQSLRLTDERTFEILRNLQKKRA